MFSNTLFLLCLWMFQFTEAVQEIYISDRNGTDNEQCGGETNPCQSIHFAWQKYLYSRNSSEYYFFLSDGSYSNENNNTLMFSCFNTNVSTISFWKTGDATAVEVNYSFMISNCQIKFTEISFRKCASHIFLSSTVRFFDVTMSENKGTVAFVQSSVYLEKFTFENSTLDHGTTGLLFTDCAEIIIVGALISNNAISQLLLISSVQMLQAKTLTFRENVNSSVIMKDGNTSSIFILQAINNKNFNIQFEKFNSRPINTLSVVENDKFHFKVSQKTVLIIITLFLQRNMGNDVADKYFDVHLSSTVAMTYGNIECNTFRNSRNDTSFFSIDESSKFGCEKCSMYNCPMKCPAGEGIVKDIFCEKCTPGYSAHAWERTCTPCFEGSYASKNSSTDCMLCSPGNFCDKRGCTSCKSCSNDFLTSDHGAANCSKMKPLLIGIIAAVVILTFGPISCLVIKKYKKQTDQRHRSVNESDGKFKKFENEE